MGEPLNVHSPRPCLTPDLSGLEGMLFPAEAIPDCIQPCACCILPYAGKSTETSEDRSSRWHKRWPPWTTADPSLRLEPGCHLPQVRVWDYHRRSID